MIELLYAALNAEYGVVVTTDSPPRLRAELYKLRKQDSSLSVLSLSLSPTNPEAELWIVKNAQE